VDVVRRSPALSTRCGGLAESTGHPVAALNIGGIANITVVGPDGGAVSDVLAYDTGPGNALLDLAVQELSGGTLRSDVDGELAFRGKLRLDLLVRLLADPTAPRRPPQIDRQGAFSHRLSAHGDGRIAGSERR
jgi:1,6-anhydro-N-acetylmuramate kinase